MNAGCNFIVTHNTKDFLKTNKFNVKVVTPAQFIIFLKNKI